MKKHRTMILFGVFLFIWFLFGCNRPIPTFRQATQQAGVPSAEPLSLTRTSLAAQIMATLTAVNVTPGLITEIPTEAATSSSATTPAPVETAAPAVTGATAPTSVTVAPAMTAAPATQTPIVQITPTPTIMVVTLPPRSPVPLASPLAPAATPLAPEAPLLPTPRPAQMISAQPEVYYLHRGEFPWCLARRFDVNPRQLMRVNGFYYRQIFYPGQAIFFPLNPQPFPGNRALRPHPSTYWVGYRETIYSIACYYGDIDPIYLAEINGVAPPYRLTPGQVLQVP